jgi:hypothetical protein
MTKNEIAVLDKLLKEVKRLQRQNRLLSQQISDFQYVPSEYEGTDVM